MDCDHDSAKMFYQDSSDKRAKPAGVHALVIGVSRYDPPRRKREQKFDDLAGTAPGAAHFARYLTDGFHDPGGRPVRTVRLLLSPIAGQENYLPPRCLWREASYDNVNDALEDWADDCDDSENNVAMLYVAGHGVVTPGGAQWAFLSRAGAVRTPYGYAINLNVIRERMLVRRARSNIYVLDCCALIGDQVPAWDGDTGLYMGERKGGGPGNVVQIVIAPRVGTSSYSLNAAEGTLLSAALVGSTKEEARQRLLYTAGEVVSNGSYAVTPRRLSVELLPAMHRIRPVQLAGDEPVVLPEESAAGITQPKPPPEFPVTLTADSAPAGAIVTVVFHDLVSGEQREGDVPPGGLTLPLPAGRHKVYVTVRGTADNFIVHPWNLSVDRAMRVTAFEGDPAP